MRWFRSIGVTGVVLLVLAAKAWGVSQCAVGCRAQLLMCMETGLVARTACQYDCIANAAPRGFCMRDCSLAYRPVRLACMADAKSCKASCLPAPDLDETCLENCAAQLGSCAGGVRTAAISCLRGCKTASDHLTCTQGCLATAQADGAGCGDDFTTCLGGCALTTP
jgi:hypothetical protein